MGGRTTSQGWRRTKGSVGAWALVALLATLLVGARAPGLAAAQASGAAESAEPSPTTAAGEPVVFARPAPVTADGTAAGVDGPSSPPPGEAGSPAGPASASVPAAGPQPVPSGLWDTDPGLPAGRTYVAMDGTYGDWVSADLDHLYTRADSLLAVTLGDRVSVSVVGDEDWTGSFGPAAGAGPLSVGYYPVSGTDDGTMYWYGDGRGCSRYVGWFAVDELTYAGGELASLTLRFAQGCDGGPAMHGKVHYVASDVTEPPGPTDVPVGLWNGDPGIDGDYVWIQGAARDWISAGVDHLLTPQDSTLSMSESGNRLYVGATKESIGNQGSEWWSGSFYGMTSVSQLRPGYYPDLQRAPFSNPAKGGIEWSGSGRGCNRLSGWFAIDEITRVNGVLKRLSLRFGQSCDGGPMLHGKVVLGSNEPSLPPGSPFGSIDHATPAPGGVDVDGWSIDPDVRDPVTVRVYVDGTMTSVIASGDRADVDRAFAGYGPAHGYRLRVDAAPGDHRVCAMALDVGVGDDRLLGCRDVTVGGPPKGALETVAVAPELVSVAGFAFDPDTAAPIQVHAYVDAASVAVTADLSRPDLAVAFPAYGAPHGYAATLAVSPGPHRVCTYGIDSGGGTNSLLGCRDVVVPDRSPFGSLDQAQAGPGRVVVRGWTIDPDTADPLAVHLYVDGASLAIVAGADRPDVGVAFPGSGAAHGFSATLGAAPGPHRVCAYAINVGPGRNALLGCRDLVAPTGPPIGSLDVVTGSTGSVRLRGWAIDPDTTQPVTVHLYVDGASLATTAAVERPDVGAAFPAYGAGHGYDVTLGAGPGSHRVCAYAIDTTGGPNTQLGCRTVTVA